MIATVQQRLRLVACFELSYHTLYYLNTGMMAGAVDVSLLSLQVQRYRKRHNEILYVVKNAESQFKPPHNIELFSLKFVVFSLSSKKLKIHLKLSTEAPSQDLQFTDSPPLQHTSMALDGILMYRLFCIYAFLFIGLWWVLYSEEDDADEYAFPVDYRGIWFVALIGLFATFSIMQGVGSLHGVKHDDTEVGKAAMIMKLFI